MIDLNSGEVIVSRSERGGVVYDLSHPDEQIAAGALLELIDFRNAARSIGASIGLGTEVFKRSIYELTGPHDWFLNNCEDHDPFCNVWRLPGDKTFAIYHEIPIKLRLNDFYIGTQAYKDMLDTAEYVSEGAMFGKKSDRLAREVLYDEAEDTV